MPPSIDDRLRALYGVGYAPTVAPRVIQLIDDHIRDLWPIIHAELGQDVPPIPERYYVDSPAALPTSLSITGANVLVFDLHASTILSYLTLLSLSHAGVNPVWTTLGVIYAERSAFKGHLEAAATMAVISRVQITHGPAHKVTGEILRLAAGSLLDLQVAFVVAHELVHVALLDKPALARKLASRLVADIGEVIAIGEQITPVTWVTQRDESRSAQILSQLGYRIPAELGTRELKPPPEGAERRRSDYWALMTSDEYTSDECFADFIAASAILRMFAERHTTRRIFAAIVFAIEHLAILQYIDHLVERETLLGPLERYNADFWLATGRHMALTHSIVSRLMPDRLTGDLYVDVDRQTTRLITDHVTYPLMRVLDFNGAIDARRDDPVLMRLREPLTDDVTALWEYLGFGIGHEGVPIDYYMKLDIGA